jgi:hypothetical protein
MRTSLVETAAWDGAGKTDRLRRPQGFDHAN